MATVGYHSTNCGDFWSERPAWSVGEGRGVCITLSDHVPKVGGQSMGFATRGVEPQRAEEILSKAILREFMKHL
jgi:hypothetical protein